MKNLSKLIKIACMAAGILCFSVAASAWGQKGHDVVCTVAQNHLSRKAKKCISNVLDGQSIIYWANWLDNASHTPEYAYSKTWHYKNIDADETFDNAAHNPSGDVINAVDSLVSVLKGGRLSHEQEALSLKMLIHLVGDMHQPLHMGHKSDLGGNKWQVQFFGKGTNLHSTWDSGIVEDCHKWSHTEWAKEIDCVDNAERVRLAAGTPADWARETYAICTKVYEGTPVGSKLSYDYVSEWTPTVEQQLLRAGLRLASLLNEIYK